MSLKIFLRYDGSFFACSDPSQRATALWNSHLSISPLTASRASDSVMPEPPERGAEGAVLEAAGASSATPPTSVSPPVPKNAKTAATPAAATAHEAAIIGFHAAAEARFGASTTLNFRLPKSGPETFKLNFSLLFISPVRAYSAALPSGAGGHLRDTRSTPPENSSESDARHRKSRGFSEALKCVVKEISQERAGSVKSWRLSE